MIFQKFNSLPLSSTTCAVILGLAMCLPTAYVSGQSAEDFGNITRSGSTASARQRAAVAEPDSHSSLQRSRPQEVSAPPGQPGALGGYSESSGYFECAQFDPVRQRCLVRALSAEQRESALQTGMDVAQYGLRIQKEALLRSQNGFNKNGGSKESFEQCIANATKYASSGNRQSASQQKRSFEQCAQ
jgi:hypothetical protein